MLTVSFLLLRVAQVNIIHKNFKTPHKPKHKNTKCTQNPTKTKKLTHAQSTFIRLVFFLPCGVGIFHCYIELLLVFFFRRNDCSLPYLELGTAPSKWGVFVKQ